MPSILFEGVFAGLPLPCCKSPFGVVVSSKILRWSKLQPHMVVIQKGPRCRLFMTDDVFVSLIGT